MNYLLIIFYSMVFYFLIYFLSIKYIHNFNQRIVKDSLYYLTESNVLTEDEKNDILFKITQQDQDREQDFFSKNFFNLKTFLLSPFKSKNDFIKLLFSSLLFFCFLIFNGFFFFNNLSIPLEKKQMFHQYAMDFLNFDFSFHFYFLTTKSINEYIFLAFILITFFIFIVDRKSKWLTNESNFFLFLLGIVFLFLNPEYQINLFYASIPLILLFIPIRLGQGDIFLLSNLTIFLGKDVLFIAFLASFIGFLIVFLDVLFLKITKRKKIKTLIRFMITQEMPHGPNLILASYIIFVLSLYYNFSFFDWLIK